MKLTLISHALCPYVQRVVIALTEKCADYECIDIDLRAKPDWFLAVSPLGKTPVLLVDGKPIFESAVICEYLEDTIAPALHPPDAFERAQHRAWIEFASVTLDAIWNFYTARDDAAYEAAVKTLGNCFAQIEKTLGEGPYFKGGQFSLIDAVFGPVFRYFDVFDAVSGVDLFSSIPKTHAWREALAQRSSIRTAVTADYHARLRQFVIDQGGVLGGRLAAA